MPETEYTPLTDEELVAIRDRAANAWVDNPPNGGAFSLDLQAAKALLTIDLPRLLAEVERLRFRCRIFEVFLGEETVNDIMGTEPSRGRR